MAGICCRFFRTPGRNLFQKLFWTNNAPGLILQVVRMMNWIYQKRGVKGYGKNRNCSTSFEGTADFRRVSGGKGGGSLVIPTIISQIITVIYNLADTWYVGLTQNAAAVAAISLCLPVYTMMTAFSNLFGVGGASALARAMGVGNTRRAKKVFTISVYGTLLCAVVYSLLMLVFARPLLMLIGGDASSIDYAVGYTRITIVLGGIPTIMSATFAHLIRAPGE